MTMHITKDESETFSSKFSFTSYNENQKLCTELIENMQMHEPKPNTMEYNKFVMASLIR